MRTLAVVRAIVFALLLAYALFSMPWSYAVLPKEGTSLALPLVIADMRSMALCMWLAVAWIGVDAYLSWRLLGREKAKAARPPEAAS